MSGYEINTVPATGDNATSRFAVGTAPSGFPTTPGSNLSLAYNHLTEELVRKAELLPPEMKSVKLERTVIDGVGKYVSVDRGTVTAPVTHVTARSGRFVKLNVSGGALLDNFVRGEEAWRDARDADVWEALRSLCEQINATGEECRALSDTVARAVLLRAGISRRPDALPLS